MNIFYIIAAICFVIVIIIGVLIKLGKFSSNSNISNYDQIPYSDYDLKSSCLFNDKERLEYCKN